LIISRFCERKEGEFIWIAGSCCFSDGQENKVVACYNYFLNLLDGPTQIP